MQARRPISTFVMIESPSMILARAILQARNTFSVLVEVCCGVTSLVYHFDAAPMAGDYVHRCRGDAEVLPNHEGCG